MKHFDSESLSHDPIHGYIPFTATPRETGEATERQLIDHPWVQRLRHIHQLQTAWWVFPSAEHTRFQHVLGAMHLASYAVAQLEESLREVCPDAPSRGYIESLMRVAALLHDVGHGPFGHFFDAHFLSQYGLTHETLGRVIICEELGDLIGRMRRNPNSALSPNEVLEPEHVATLIARPKAGQIETIPQWLAMLRSLFCGLYTVDNMDFVLRDSYMSGYNQRAFDLERLLHYSFFSEAGLTIHRRGIQTLVRFLGVRAELFQTIYFHRTVRSIDLTLQDLFAESKEFLFPGDPREHLNEYRQFTESSLLVDVGRWGSSADERKRAVAPRWQDLLERRIRWRMACERTRYFGPSDAEQGSIFSEPQFVEMKLREKLPAPLKQLPLRVDVARHVHRPGTQGPTAGQNFLYDPARQETRTLSDSELYRRLPLSFNICRIYAETADHDRELAEALDALIGPGGPDDATNM